MNYTKTKIITNTDENITTRINQEKIERVEEYIYLGQMIKLKKENQTAEIKRRVRLAWAAFGKLSYILKNKRYPQYLKTKVYNPCVLPALRHEFAGHNVRQKVDRWNKCIVNWRPWENRRSRGRPQMRWADDLRKHAGTRWMSTATESEEWKRLGEAYVQRWI
ncbi:uncharacterized protein LOC115890677 [Sitophilus oryzae]|uniref:Uncharacterized protein LOC115890677 n=1 Tax=Sitophilus oryzae TaxID=7048 RepID=A0A6J2YU77_SITOR|nr:uncharacterized protein LOC115890677 [Sitophilus oryzae]